MRFIKTFCFFLLLYCSFVHASEPQKITATCPYPSELIKTHNSDSWAAYLYSGYSNVNLPEIGNQIYLSGKSSAPAATDFYAATWTDTTFLCLYNKADAIVLYETVLAPYVDRCYFQNGTDNAKDECNSTDPKICPITCELKPEFSYKKLK